MTDGSRSSIIQCHQPEPVGASGSKHVTAKAAVSSGKPAQDNWGETSRPATWASGSVSPSATSADVTSNDGTWGRKSYGHGACGRSSVIVILLLIGVGCGTGEPRRTR